MRGLCEQHGFRFLDLKPVLVEESRREYERSGALLWWSDDTHWNGEGQRAAARAVYENLLGGALPSP
jgi:lysophospholipase L1-like esterase